MPEVNDRPLTKDYLEILIGRLENKIDAKFNGLESRINSLEGKINGLEGKLNAQRYLLIVAILGIIGQIVNSWVLHVR